MTKKRMVAAPKREHLITGTQKLSAADLDKLARSSDPTHKRADLAKTKERG